MSSVNITENEEIIVFLPVSFDFKPSFGALFMSSSQILLARATQFDGNSGLENVLQAQVTYPAILGLLLVDRIIDLNNLRNLIIRRWNRNHDF